MLKANIVARRRKLPRGQVRVTAGCLLPFSNPCKNVNALQNVKLRIISWKDRTLF